MASNHTANFGLNQWAATDPVLREDFNEDNQKIEEAMAGFGNCRIVTGSYAGTGTYGVNSPNHLSFEHKPVFMVVGDRYIFLRPYTGASSVYNANYYSIVTWGDKDITWYSTDSAAEQINESGKTHYYVALLLADDDT